MFFLKVIVMIGLVVIGVLIIRSYIPRKTTIGKVVRNPLLFLDHNIIVCGYLGPLKKIERVEVLVSGEVRGLSHHGPAIAGAMILSMAKQPQYEYYFQLFDDYDCSGESILAKTKFKVFHRSSVIKAEVIGKLVKERGIYVLEAKEINHI